MLDHIFLTVGNLERSIAFYESVLPILGINRRLDYDGSQGPTGHPDLKGFGANGKVFFWLRAGQSAPGAVHVGFVAESGATVDAAYAAAIGAGAQKVHEPGPQLHYDPRYYAAQVTDLDGYSLEFVYKAWQHQTEDATASQDLQSIVDDLLAATNAFDTDAAVALFSAEAVIDDPSTGERFTGQQGVRDYVERFFVGYHTVSLLLSTTPLDEGRTRAWVDFTGDFGHEIGRLDLAFDKDGLITRIDDLEQ